MAGKYQEIGRDPVVEVIEARKAPIKTQEDKTREEREAFKLFSALTAIVRECDDIPSDKLPELSPLPDNLPEAEREEELSRREYQQFMAEIGRRNKIAGVDHFVVAMVEKDEEVVEVKIQLQPGHGDVSLEHPAAFTISLPESTIDDVLIVREKSLQGDPKTATRLLSYLIHPTTQIKYRPEPKTSVSS
ncbi:MAG TPA: hypothetical protein VMR77_02060 [Patescibacteria group bacterium]|jgi:hypothetical protein|nr:hypothetical protein [Patescibacteria group bacterium]